MFCNSEWVDELLDKAEASTGGMGFCCKVLVVIKQTGGLHPIPNFNQFSCYMYIYVCLTYDYYQTAMTSQKLLWFSHPLLSPFCLFGDAKVFVLLFIKKICQVMYF